MSGQAATSINSIILTIYIINNAYYYIFRPSRRHSNDGLLPPVDQHYQHA